MATRGSIEFDFKQAMLQAEKVDEIADHLSELSGKRFQSTMQNLSGNWKGDNANKYMAKGERLQDKIEVTVKELRNTATDIRRIARSMYNAEMAALDIATQRTY